MSWIDAVQFNEQGLVPAIAQCSESKDILMMAWMSRESLELSIELKRAVYYSRSRQSLWQKGEQSGNTQELIDISLDCDGDCILLTVKQIGNVACHTGRKSCFFHTKVGDNWQINQAPIKSPKEMYNE